MEMEQLKAEFKRLDGSVADIKKVLDEVHGAIVGNPLSKDGGMAKRLYEAEQQLEKLSKRLGDAEKKQIKFNVYTIIMWCSLGGVVGLFTAYLFQLIFKK